jgi:hypothetical protein
VPVVLEHDFGALQPSVALDVHLLIGVDQDVGNFGVLDQRFQWAEAKDLVQHLHHNRVALLEVERDRFLGDEVLHDPADRLGDLLPVEPIQVREIQPLQQLPVNPAFDLLKRVDPMRPLRHAEPVSRSR